MTWSGLQLHYSCLSFPTLATSRGGMFLLKTKGNSHTILGVAKMYTSQEIKVELLPAFRGIVLPKQEATLGFLAHLFWETSICFFQSFVLGLIYAQDIKNKIERIQGKDMCTEKWPWRKERNCRAYSPIQNSNCISSVIRCLRNVLVTSHHKRLFHHMPSVPLHYF